MDNELVRVTVERDGPVCVLAVSGELDLIAAAGFAERAARAVDDTARRLVLDLSGLRFIDCCGARALAAVTRAVPDDCSVMVHSARPIVRRVLGLLDLDLQRRHGGASAVPATWLDGRYLRVESEGRAPAAGGRLVWQSRETWARSQDLIAQSRALAGVVAETEDTVALTYARLAERRSARAERLRQLSRHAHQEAARMRELAHDRSQPPAQRTDLGRGRAAAREAPLGGVGAARAVRSGGGAVGRGGYEVVRGTGRASGVAAVRGRAAADGGRIWAEFR